MKIIKSLLLGCLGAVAITPLKVLADPIQVPLPRGQWQSILNAKNKVNIFLNPGSLIRQGDLVAYWLKLDFAKSNDVTSMYFAGNCATSAIVPLWQVSANHQGRILRSTKINQPAGVLQPGSLDWKIFNVACNWSLD